jgi:hypothetical protein
VHIPGFSAEASLYKTSGHYRIIRGGGTTTARVFPAVNYCEYICDRCRTTGLEWACLQCAVSHCRPELDEEAI